MIAGIEAGGMNPDDSPKVEDLRTQIKSDAVDIGALESEVYDHLFRFFRRYYSEGDFLAKRVYKPGVYAIPYEGEEVTLYWANKDQYYIKTSEYLRDYAFRLRPGDEKRPMRVHFRLADAAEGEHGNVKAAEESNRVFVLTAPGESGHDFMAEEDGEQGKELVVLFEYRPATLTDWSEEERLDKKRPPVQKDLVALATKRILAGDRRRIGRMAPRALCAPRHGERRDGPTTADWRHISSATLRATPSTTSSIRTLVHSFAESWTSTSRTRSCTSTTWRTNLRRVSSSTFPRSRLSARSRARLSIFSPNSRTSKRSCG